ncbi:MAG: DUF2892 domain-containing protein [Capnocytophaga sp.]|nr:DUF2892 domain-containing protein [Capnocytophaga sp.]
METNNKYCRQVTKHERIVRFIAGLFVLVSVIITYFTSQMLWLLIALFVALNLMQSSLTKWCLLNDILKALKIKDN